MSDENANLNNQDGTGGGDSLIAGSGDKTGAPAGDLPAWMAQNPDDLKANEILAQNPTIGDLSRNFLELHGKLEGSVKVPGEGATQEEIDGFMENVKRFRGVPDSADGYEIDASKLPEGLKITEDGMKEFKALAHSLGLNASEAQGVFDAWNAKEHANYQAMITARKQAYEAGVKALKSEWGAEFDTKVALAVKGIEATGGKELADLLTESGIDNHPVILRALSTIGEAFSENRSLEGSKGPDGDGRKRDPLTKRPMMKFNWDLAKKE